MAAVASRKSRARPESASTEDAAAVYESLQQIVRRFRVRDEDAICGYGISVRECHALEALIRHPLSVNGLAEILGLDKSTVSRLVQRLVAEKLVLRKADQSDSRAITLDLTAKGRRVYEAAYSDSVACYRELLEKVPADEREAMIEALQRTAALINHRDKCGG